jgi:hypothetical protein
VRKAKRGVVPRLSVAPESDTDEHGQPKELNYG